MNDSMIAPCGINCKLCRAHLRKRNQCVGCNSRGNKPNHCLRCKIRNCRMKARKSDFCFECKKFPCEMIKHLDDRYRAKYATSVIANLNDIKKNGTEKFARKQLKKYTCSCGGLICMHTGKCSSCGK